jgi:hypothetical protein
VFVSESFERLVGLSSPPDEPVGVVQPTTPSVSKNQFNGSEAVADRYGPISR